MQVELSQEFDRPPSVVFRFLVIDHIANHPRWDPQMELWPSHRGSHRPRQRHRSAPVAGRGADRGDDGGRRVRAGPLGRLARPRRTVRDALQRCPSSQLDGGRTRVTIRTELPDAVKAVDPSFVERSLRNMKALVEAET